FRARHLDVSVRLGGDQRKGLAAPARSRGSGQRPRRDRVGTRVSGECQARRGRLRASRAVASGDGRGTAPRAASRSARVATTQQHVTFAIAPTSVGRQLQCSDALAGRMMTKRVMTKTKETCYFATVAVGFAAFLALQQNGQAVRIGADAIGGVVSGPNGPEAGVWVIAETTDLPTKFVRIVVTDDQGRYVIPDLPKASYRVWARGYGLVDSPQAQAVPGAMLNLSAVVAPNPRAAAEYYPAGYWFSLMRVPVKSEFASTGADGNGMAPNVKSQAGWIRILKSGGCWACHQLGSKGTREIPKALGTFESSTGAWLRRLESSADYLPVLDPVHNTTSRVPLTVRDPNTQPAAGPPTQPSPYWGSEVLWTSKNNVHNPMFYERGRVWLTSTVRPPDNPPFCQ